MNPEQLHDALTQLPDDLITEVDALRRPRKPGVVAWKKIFPTAACAAIVLLGALTLPGLRVSKETALEQCADEAAPAEAAPIMEAAQPEKDQISEKSQLKSPAEAPLDNGAGRSAAADEAAPLPLTARYLPVHPSLTEGGQRVTVISNRKELEGYLADSSPDEALRSACEGYDDAYFEDQQLVLLLTVKYRPAASYSGNVLLPLESGTWSAEKAADGRWTLRVQDMVLDESANDVVRQHILLEVPGKPLAPADTIRLAP